jgi:hypothetical protein
VLRPRLERGAERAGRDPSACRLAVGPLVATGAHAAEVAAERERVRQLLGFLFSTPAYLVDDAMLAALAPTGRCGEIALPLGTSAESPSASPISTEGLASSP